MAAAAPAAAFTSPAVSQSAAASTTSLNAFGIKTLKKALAPEIKGAFPEDISEEEVRSLFYLWNDALATGDSRIVAKRYSSDPILLPTVSDTPRTDYEGLKDYFDHFLTLQPQGEVLEGKIKIGPGWAKDAGVYEFTMGASGDKIKARYSYVYIYEDGEWKIAHHHSSMMPEAPAGKTITVWISLFFLTRCATVLACSRIFSFHILSV